MSNAASPTPEALSTTHPSVEAMLNSGGYNTYADLVKSKRQELRRPEVYVSIQQAIAALDAQVQQQIPNLAEPVLRKLALSQATYLKETVLNSTLDPLTGFLTRGTFFREVDNYIATFGGKFVVCMVDIDNFKTINDCHAEGHSAGDNVLRLFGELANETLPSNALVGRYGGEEIIILLPENQVNADETKSIIEELNVRFWGMTQDRKLRAEFRDPTTSASDPKRDFDGHISCGIHVWMPSEETIDVAQQKSDEALYDAKKIRGKNIAVIWKPDMERPTS